MIVETKLLITLGILIYLALFRSIWNGANYMRDYRKLTGGEKFLFLIFGTTILFIALSAALATLYVLGGWWMAWVMA